MIDTESRQKEVDSWSSLPLKVQPDGSVLYDFDGHVHARGVDLDADPQGGTDNRVIWRRVSDGAIVAIDEGTIIGGDIGANYMWAHSPDAPISGGPPFAALAVRAQSPGAYSEVYVAVNGTGNLFDTRMVYNTDGKSSFPQLGEAVAGVGLKTVMRAARTSAAGVILSQTGGLTCVRTSLGNYVYTWPAMTSIPVIIPSVESGSGVCSVQVLSSTVSGCTIYIAIHTATTLTAADRINSLTVLGIG